MDVSFEFIPEGYEGNFPYIVVRIKQSQLTPNLRSRIEESLGKLSEMLDNKPKQTWYQDKHDEALKKEKS